MQTFAVPGHLRIAIPQITCISKQSNISKVNHNMHTCIYFLYNYVRKAEVVCTTTQSYEPHYSCMLAYSLRLILL